MKFKLGSILLIIFLLLVVLNTAAAEDSSLVGADNGLLMVENNDNTVALDDSGVDNVKLSSEDSQSSLKASEVGNYTELQQLINSNSNGVINLEKDYAYADSEKGVIGITNSIVINGNGHYISGGNKTMSLYITNTTHDVVLNNISFINGNGLPMLRIDGNNCLVDNCTFNDNHADFGGAVKIIGTQNTIQNSVFKDNGAYGRDDGKHYDGTGGAIYLLGAAYKNVIKNCSFYDNTAELGASICVNGHETLISDCIFENNTVSKSGGSIFVNGHDNVINDCTFENNNASKSGGSIYVNSPENVINNSKFINNVAGDGGAVVLTKTGNLIDNSIFENNNASQTAGGAVAMYGSYSVINNSKFNKNNAGSLGAAIYIAPNANNNKIINSEFNENLLRSNQSRGSALNIYGNNVEVLNSKFNNHTSFEGGAIYWIGDNGIINCSEFNKNTARDGGAIYWSGNNGLINGTEFNENTASIAGALYIESPNLTVNNSKFSKNTADMYAGAILSIDNATVSNSEFYQNVANEAGAIEIYGKNNLIESSTFTENKAIGDSQEYADFGRGGAIVIEDISNSEDEKHNNIIRASVFNNNNANKIGGAIYVNSKGNLINGSEFYYNTANVDAGAVSLYVEDNVVDNSLFEHNNACSGGAVQIYRGNALVNNSEMNYNHAIEGGAILVFTGNNVTINNSQFNENNASSNGGAIIWYGDDGTIDHSEFNKNYVNAKDDISGYGGAVYWIGNDATINNSKFTGNTALNNGNLSGGGAIAIEGINANIEDSTFVDNVAGSYGGAIDWFGDDGTLYNSTFTGNNASNQGGAVHSNGKNIVIDDSTFTDNHAFFLGGAVALESTGTIDNSKFIENTANKGGAVFWDAPNGTVNNSYFHKNSAVYAGGAISCDYTFPNSEKIIQNSVFEENSCVNYGGAIATLNANIVGSTFKDNKANVGEAIHAYSSKIENSPLISNDAVVQTTEIIQINPDDIIGNSTRRTNTSYIAMCVERYTNFPHLGLKDDSLDKMVNIINGTPIADYLKILIFTYFNSTDDAYEFAGKTIDFYPEAYRDNPDRMNHLEPIPLIDYYSRAVHEFSDHEFWNSTHPVVHKVLELYETVYGNGTKMPEKFIKRVGNYLIEYNFSSMISPTSQSLFLFDMIKHELTDINVTKVWNDAENQDGIRPENVTVELFNGTDVIDKFVLNASNDWKHTFSDLMVYCDGKVINYTIREVNVGVDGYESVVTNSTPYNWTVTNTHVPDVTDVSVVKVWNDNKNQDGVRPDSVVVQLLADGKVINSAVLNASNEWKHTFTGLAVRKNGTVVVYTINETDVPAGYTVNITGDSAYSFTVNNTHVPDVTDVSVVKVWNDNDNQDGVRSESVVVVLKADGNVVGTATLNASNNWSHDFENLSVYSNGKEIVYSVEEVSVANYTSVVSADSAYSFIVNNTHVPVVTDVSVVKVWNDNDNQDGVRPESIVVVLKADGNAVETATLNASNNWSASFKGLSVYKNNGTLIEYSIEELKVANYTSVVSADSAYSFIVNNTHVPVVTVVDVSKVWNDNDNQDGVRPADITVVLKADGNVVGTATLNANNNWYASFADLPVYSNGKVIEYSVEEVSVANYTSNVSNDAYSFTINNVHVPVVTVVDVSKVWNDAENQDGVRPASVTVVLKADGDVVGTATLNANNNWKSTFADLPVYSNGKLIQYSVEELDVSSYVAVVSNNTQYSFIVTNIHVPETTSVNVTKVWNDNDNQDGIRPGSVTVVLKGDDDVVGTATLNANNNWYASFEDLPVYSNGKLIKYSVEEVSVSNYTSVVSSDDTYSFIVNNTHVPLVTLVNITKVWGDDNDRNEEPVVVIIYADGVEVANVTLNPGNDWKFTFDDLPVYNDGKEINYTIGVVDGDRTVNITKGEGNFTVFIEPELHPDMSVRKITLDTEVEVGDIVSFEIVVENTGDCALTGVYVIDDDYSEGLEYLYMESDDDWIDEGDGLFTLARALGVGESTSFIVFFEATTAGFKVNNVTAGNNLTNETVKSSNTTNVTEEEFTEPDVPVEEPDVPQKHHVPKHVKPDSHATGNPILLLLLALVIPIIRRKQN